MSAFTTIEYSKVWQAYIDRRVTYKGDVEYQFSYYTTWRGESNTYGRFAVLPNGNSRPDEYIDSFCEYERWKARGASDKKVFVSSSSKMPRDIIRQNYKIVRDIENADIVLLPNLSEKINESSTNILVSIRHNDEEKPVLVMVDLVWKQRERAKEFAEDIEAIKTSLEQYFRHKYAFEMDCSEQEVKMDIVVCDFSARTSKKVYFVPKCKEYLDILSNNAKTATYLYDSELPYKTTSNINLETLKIWSACKDDTILMANILQSDWRDYPLTLSLFALDADFKYRAMSYKDSFGVVMRSLYTEFLGLNQLPPILISQADWNLAQDYIFTKIGIDADRAYIDEKQFDKLPRCIKRLIYHKTAVSKKKVNEDILLGKIVLPCED